MVLDAADSLGRALDSGELDPLLAQYAPPSALEELREVRGDGRPLLSCSGVTWDWKAGAPVPLGMLLPERSRRRQLLEGIRQAGEGELRSGSCLLDPDWKETARRKFRASRFCLRPEGIELFYPQCSLAPAVEGVPSFRVPLAGAAWTAGEGTASET